MKEPLKKRTVDGEEVKRNAKDSYIGPGGFAYKKVAPPKSVKDVPRYLKEVLGGFFYRLFYIFSLVWHTGPWILFVMLSIAVITGIMPVLGAVISKEILNEMQVIITDGTGKEILENFWTSSVMFLLIFLFVYRILNRVVGSLESAVTHIAGEKVVSYIKLQIMRKSEEIDLAAYDMPEFYEKLENANREAGMRPVQILSATFRMLSTLIGLVSYAVIISAAFPLAALCVVIVSIPSAAVSFVYRHKHFKYMRHRSKERRQMNYYSEIMVNKDVVKEIRLFDLGGTFVNKYKAVFDGYYSGIRRLVAKESIWTVIMAFVSSSVNCVFYAIIAMGVVGGDYKIGDYSLYTNALSSIAGAVASLIGISATIYEGTLFIDNLIAFMKADKSIKAPKVSHVLERGVPHTVEFKNVSFAYPGTDRMVIKNVSFTLEPGETTVLVGLNGAGKTTLIKLLTRLYDPTEGAIYLDGVNIKEYDPKDLYRMFGIIFQDFGKYACTVSENIAFGEVGAERDDERVVGSAESANADDFIERLPAGYETPLMRIFERDGIELSIGQWQKLAIARAFYSDSDVLILDEPTASLDAIAEQEIYSQFEELRKDKTTIFVSHRLSSATTASKIIVLEYGELIEMGTHKELMAKEGRYYELFSTQAKHYVEGAESE
ncbi:MAG: ABC transporter ATP-binding protein [Clostridia bacterium]|nr:ABC transporter ATP-binding protein [Clostridia bacterium]